jgi:hypothetical protein
MLLFRNRRCPTHIRGMNLELSDEQPLSLRRPQSQFVGRERSGQAGDAGSENDDVPGIA